MQLDQYLKFFPRESILAFTLEEFQAAPSNLLGRCCEFLEISEDFEFRGETEPRNTGDFYGVHPFIASLAGNEWLRSVGRVVLTRKAHHGIREFFARRSGEGATSGRWRLSEAEEDRILREISSDLKRLVQEYGVDVHGLWSVPHGYLD